MSTHYPHYTSRPVQSLDGIWDFAFVENVPDPRSPDLSAVTYTHRMAVPGVFDTLPDFAGRRGTGFYRRRVTVSPKARELLLRCDGLGIWGAFFWDGQLIGVHDMPYSGMSFRFEAGDGAEHELVAVVDNRFDFARQPLLSQYYDYYCFGGLFRSLELHEIPAKALDRVHVRTLTLKGRVEVTVRFLNPRGKTAELRYRIDGGKAVETACPVQNGCATFTAKVPSPTLWSPEHPALHTIEVSFGTDTVVERFGLRTVEAKGKRILLNGEPIQLRGFCRHESHPEFGPALPAQVLLEDLQLLRQMGCNFVRGSHYPQDPRFLDLCDEMGILVWEETVGWGDRAYHLQEETFRAAQLRQPEYMVRNSYNHPCVILWGFLNEGDSTDPNYRGFYAAMASAFRALDSSRLVVYASMFDSKDINFDLVDVVCLNTYPGWYANQESYRPLDEVAPRLDHFLEWVDSQPAIADKPVIISEIGAGAIYGWRDRFRAHWTEEYQSDFLDVVLSYIGSHPRISGVSLWLFTDTRTYSSARALGRPRAFNNKGVFDEYRRPKLAVETVTRHFQSQAVASTRP